MNTKGILGVKTFQKFVKHNLVAKTEVYFSLLKMSHLGVESFKIIIKKILARENKHEKNFVFMQLNLSFRKMNTFYRQGYLLCSRQVYELQNVTFFENLAVYFLAKKSARFSEFFVLHI